MEVSIETDHVITSIVVHPPEGEGPKTLWVGNAAGSIERYTEDGARYATKYTAHGGKVLCMAAGEGDVLVSGGSDCLVIASRFNGELIHKFTPHLAPVRCVLPQGDQLLSSDFFGDVFIHSAYSTDPTGAPPTTYKGHTDCVPFILPHENAGSFLSCSYDATLKLWEAAEGKTLCDFKGHEGHVVGMNFAKGCVVSVSRDCTMRVWSCGVKGEEEAEGEQTNNTNKAGECLAVIGFERLPSLLVGRSGQAFVATSHHDLLQFDTTFLVTTVQQYIADKLYAYNTTKKTLTETLAFAVKKNEKRLARQITAESNKIRDEFLNEQKRIDAEAREAKKAEAVEGDEAAPEAEAEPEPEEGDPKVPEEIQAAMTAKAEELTSLNTQKAQELRGIAEAKIAEAKPNLVYSVSPDTLWAQPYCCTVLETKNVCKRGKGKRGVGFENYWRFIFECPQGHLIVCNI